MLSRFEDDSRAKADMKVREEFDAEHLITAAISVTRPPTFSNHPGKESGLFNKGCLLGTIFDAKRHFLV